LEYADVFPIIYCKIRLEGMQTYDHVKHLLVDEMQDYTPVQYAVLSRIFHCRKTILGDVSQTVNPYSASSAETIEEVFPQGDVVKLFRSYRSTVEITLFAQGIKHNPGIITIERHGAEPVVSGFTESSQEVAEVQRLIEVFRVSTHRSLAIICKTQHQAVQLFNQIKQPGFHLLTADSAAFHQGVVVTNAHVAKGLEFDQVIVPFATAENYRTDVDRSMLYIACTRAMHELKLTYTGERSAFLA
jgi:DNA helicase-2/ATP-dependent DNA helicase PcrA